MQTAVSAETDGLSLSSRRTLRAQRSAQSRQGRVRCRTILWQQATWKSNLPCASCTGNTNATSARGTLHEPSSHSVCGAPGSAARPDGAGNGNLGRRSPALRAEASVPGRTSLLAATTQFARACEACLADAIPPERCCQVLSISHRAEPSTAA